MPSNYLPDGKEVSPSCPHRLLHVSLLFIPWGVPVLFSFLLSSSQKISSVSLICSGSAADFIVQSARTYKINLGKNFCKLLLYKIHQFHNEVQMNPETQVCGLLVLY
jgi:hypothetical protein